VSALLEVQGLTKRFGGLTAVKDVSFVLDKGEIAGILGPNGAGKTTLFNLLTAFIPPDAGTIAFDGDSIRGLPPYRIVNRGLARTFQLCRPFVGMSAQENVMVGCLGAGKHGRLTAGARALELLVMVGLDRKAHMPSEVLSYGDLRRLEIARALATNPKLLLLDEPFAGLGTGEIAPLSELIRKLHREQGLTILIIEHRLREFMKLVKRVIAMDFGEVIAVGDPEQIVRDPRVIEAYIGREEEHAPA
jgi:branched-chain amino acid transport system ATP-binding protein